MLHDFGALNLGFPKDGTAGAKALARASVPRSNAATSTAARGIPICTTHSHTNTSQEAVRLSFDGQAAHDPAGAYPSTSAVVSNTLPACGAVHFGHCALRPLRPSNGRARLGGDRLRAIEEEEVRDSMRAAQRPCMATRIPSDNRPKPTRIGTRRQGTRRNACTRGGTDRVSMRRCAGGAELSPAAVVLACGARSAGSERAKRHKMNTPA